jgi:hypothetical protein
MKNQLLISVENFENKFFLKSNDETLGTVTWEREDWPWNFGVFSPSERFANYKALFDAAIAERKDPDESLKKIIKMSLQLIRCDTGTLAGKPDLLWIDGNRVWWRGHDGVLENFVNKDKT